MSLSGSRRWPLKFLAGGVCKQDDYPSERVGVASTLSCMTDQRVRVLARFHRNGLLASVSHIPALGLFLAGAERPGVAHYEGTATTLDEAKAMADRDAHCLNPRTCPAWGTFE